MNKEVKRGYVKWTDEYGVFHKEPLADHPDLLRDASPEEQLRAEEVRRMNAAASEQIENDADKDAQETLAALKQAPADVLTAAQLVSEEPAAAPQEDAAVTVAEDHDDEHKETLDEFRERTAG